MNIERRHHFLGRPFQDETAGYPQSARVPPVEKKTTFSSSPAANLLRLPVPLFRVREAERDTRQIQVEPFEAESWSVPLKTDRTSVDREFGFSS